jgi:hypothetical protein
LRVVSVAFKTVIAHRVYSKVKILVERDAKYNIYNKLDNLPLNLSLRKSDVRLINLFNYKKDHTAGKGQSV